MDLNELMKNVYGKDNEVELQKAITQVRNQFSNLTEDSTCMIYSSLLFDTLRENHIPARLINTNDLGYQYEHYFILVPSNKEGYMLSDLTFSQFGDYDANFSDLLIAGYQKMSDDELKKYLLKVTRENKEIDFDKMYYGQDNTSIKR